MRSLRLAPTLACAVLLGAPAAHAQITFRGSDPGVGAGGARPNSDAAAVSFAAAAALLGMSRLITFEGLAPGPISGPLSLGNGVTYTARNPDGGAEVSTASSTLFGYNTTAGGTTHLRYSSSTAGDLDATFSFVTPIVGFGAYFTGVGTNSGAASVLFDDGSSQQYRLTAQSNGGVQFFGFTDAGRSISAVTLRGNIVDVFGIDDVRYVAAPQAVVPEPRTYVLLAAGLGGVLALKRRARSA